MAIGKGRFGGRCKVLNYHPLSLHYRERAVALDGSDGGVVVRQLGVS